MRPVTLRFPARNAIVVASLVCAACPSFFAIQTEPTSIAECDDMLNQNLRPQCKDYITAKEAYANGDYRSAESYLARSGLGDETWGKAFAAEIAGAAEASRRADPLVPGSVRGIDILFESETLCAVKPARFKIVASLVGGTKKETWSDPALRKGFIDIDNFTITSPHASWRGEGPVLDLAGDFAVYDDGFAITVALKGNPDMNATRTLKPDLACVGGIFAGGGGGGGGSSGRDGQGFSNSTECRGRNGGNGQRGMSGGRGGSGPDMVVDVGYSATQLFPGLVVARVGKTLAFAVAGKTITI